MICNRKMKQLHFIIVYEQGECSDARIVPFSLVCERVNMYEQGECNDAGVILFSLVCELSQQWCKSDSVNSEQWCESEFSL